MSIEHNWKCVTDENGIHIHDELASRDTLTGFVIKHRVSRYENYFCTQMVEGANERALFDARPSSPK